MRHHLLPVATRRGEGTYRSVCVPCCTARVAVTVQLQVYDHLSSKLPKGVVTYYHSGIEDPAERARRQRRWSRDKARVMVATIAFGMGASSNTNLLPCDSC